MPFMNVWFVWNQRTSATCAWEGCQELLGTIEPAVQGVLSYGSGPSRRFRWHPHCYIAQGLAFLEENPPALQSRGHRTNKHFNPEQQKHRHALIAKKSRVKRLKTRAVENGFWWKMHSLEAQIKGIDDMLDSMEAEYESQG